MLQRSICKRSSAKHAVPSPVRFDLLGIGVIVDEGRMNLSETCPQLRGNLGPLGPDRRIAVDRTSDFCDPGRSSIIAGRGV